MAKALPRWGGVLAWAMLEAIGFAQDPESRCTGAVAVFDALRLRQAIAEALMKLGLEGEDRWRAAARIRASVAHPAWCPAAKEPSSQQAPALSWEHDPDVAWLLAVHEHEGTRYFNKESFEQLIWWSTLGALVGLTEADETEALMKIEAEIRDRFRTAAEGGYQVEALLDTARQTPGEKPSTKDTKVH